MILSWLFPWKERRGMGFQTPHKKEPNRYDHVWFKLEKGPLAGKWKCCLCGALTSKPPEYPTDPEWRPERVVPLTAEERQLCPPSKVGFS